MSSPVLSDWGVSGGTDFGYRLVTYLGPFMPHASMPGSVAPWLHGRDQTGFPWALAGRVPASRIGVFLRTIAFFSLSQLLTHKKFPIIASYTN